MLRQDVFFAERNFSEICCIKRLQKATEMKNYSSKRKRLDEQYLAPEAASSVYEGAGMGFLTTPFTSGTHTEVEHPRKLLHPSTEKAVSLNTGTTHTVHRVALNGANQVLSSEQLQQFINSTVLARHRTITKPGSASKVVYWSHGQSESRPTQQANQVLSSEQIQQFINSTVLARHRTITKPGSASNVGYWSHGQSESRPTQQNFQASDIQQIISMGRTATQSNVAPQIQGHTSIQKVAPLDIIVPRKQTQQCAKTGVFYGQNQQTKQYATIATEQICPQIKKCTDKRQKKPKTKHTKVPQGSQTAPNVGNVHNGNNQQESDGLTTTNHVTTGDHFQNSPTIHSEPWSLVPQPVLMHVKPMEAQTNQTISKMLALREAEKNGYHQVVGKRKLDTQQSDCSGRKRKKIKGQSQGHTSEQLSTEQAGGKTVRRIVVPPKVSQNPTNYPPYVNRIMNILARGQQNQTEISDDNQCTNEKLTQKKSDDPRTESVSKEIKQEVTTSRNVGVKQFFEDLSCDAILNTDKFYGPDPELFGTSGDQCSVANVPFL